MSLCTGSFLLVGTTLVAVLIMIAEATYSSLQASTQAKLPVLTRVAQIRRLTADQARLGYSVELRGVITYNAPEWGATFLQDSTAGIYVRTTGVTTKLYQAIS